MDVRAPDFALVLAACSKHASGWGIVWTSHDFANEAKLSRSNHVLDARDVVKHLTHLVILYSPLLNVAHREVNGEILRVDVGAIAAGTSSHTPTIED